ncbi:MAG: DUF4381 domain-containing protein [Pseudomonas sp.]|jgi:hypothetical protein|nr:DUF4381 domain-containing protein [Pseudomonas sp.]
MINIEQLQPIALPSPISWWPLALGWWLLCGALLIAIILWRYVKHRRLQRKQLKRTMTLDPLRESALQQLHALPKPLGGEQAGPWLQQLNQLLKRVCSARYPNYASHTLSGREWLAFLDSRCPAAGLTRWMILVNGSYQPDCRLDDKSILQLHKAIDTWIRKHV